MGNKTISNFIPEESLCGKDLNCKVFQQDEANEIKTRERSNRIQIILK